MFVVTSNIDIVYENIDTIKQHSIFCSDTEAERHAVHINYKQSVYGQLTANKMWSAKTWQLYNWVLLLK